MFQQKSSKTLEGGPSAENSVTQNTISNNQSKLKIGSTNDIFEQQADQVANSALQNIGGNRAQSLQPFQMATAIQKSGESAGNFASNEITNEIASNQNKGESLSSSLKTGLENSIGADFSNVKIHTDSVAKKLSQQLNAKAFTVGNDIYFNDGNYKPETSIGQHLLAHELTHTIQQKGEKSIQKEDKTKNPSSKLEIDFKLLPPKLQFTLSRFLLEGDTSKVHLDFTQGQFKTSLAYKYGDALSGSLKLGAFSGSAGYKPGSEGLNLGLNYKKDQFSASLTGNPWQSKLGLNLHYGAKLLPFQTEMSNTFTAGGNAVGSMLTSLSGAMDDPMGYYSDNKSNITAVGEAVDLVDKITESGKSKIRFGADFGLTYDPDKKVIVTAKIGFNF